MGDDAQSIKHRSETIWKLVDAQCAQVSDAVLATRAPLLLSLAWALAMCWQIYVADYGALVPLRSQADTRFLQVHASSDAAAANYCRVAIKGVPFDPHSSDFKAKREACEAILKGRMEWYERQALEARMISLPEGLSRISETDVATIGQVGLMLILLWGVFAVRRENASLCAVVTREHKKRWPKFDLSPRDEILSAEHLVYAYRSISQRFLFLTPDSSAMFVALTVALISFPSAIAIWNTWGDAAQIYGIKSGDLISQNYIDQLHAIVKMEIVTIGAIILLTMIKLYYALDSAALLDGWRLAVRDVWMQEWDESANHPASTVKVDLFSRSAQQE